MARGNDNRTPGAERRQSTETFVEGLADIDQPVNEAYSRTMLFKGVDIAPFWFTKGMPLATDEQGARYIEGIVPAETKERKYRDPVVTETFTGDGVFERGGRRLFIGPPGANSVPLAGMDSHQGRMPKAPDPTGEVAAAEMLDAYAMEQLRDVPFTAWPNEPTGPDGDSCRPVDAILEDPDAPAALTRTLQGCGRTCLGPPPAPVSAGTTVDGCSSSPAMAPSTGGARTSRSSSSTMSICGRYRPNSSISATRPASTTTAT